MADVVDFASRSIKSFKGRGKNKTVALEVSFHELDRWAKRMSVDTKRLWARSYGRSVKGLRDKFRKVVTRAGGVEGVPKFKDFEAFTVALRRARGRTAPMGGILAERQHIVGFRRNGWQYIGWPDDLAEWAVNFQDGVGGSSSESFLADSSSRHYLHRMGIHDIPRAYVHNPRRIIPQPFGTYVVKHLKDWATGAYYKELARQMRKAAK